MRTNTWLGLIAINQSAQIIQSSRLSREQEARDKERDEKFAQAQEESRRGQFAMWIQTPDGQLFERWSGHALLASRAIDDRQVAWDRAWEQDYLARREGARPATVAEAESKVAHVSSEDVRRARHQGVIAAIISSILMAIWLTLVIAAPVSESGEVTVTPVSVIAFFLMGIAMVITGWRFWSGNALNRRGKLVSERVENFLSATVLPRSASWHRRADARRLREVESKIGEVVESASTTFPRRDRLVQLAGTYDTRPDEPGSEQAPEQVRRLLAAFREEDRERRSALQLDGLA